MSPHKWAPDQLQHIVEADDLHVAPLREDGVTFGTPTWIWCVAVDGRLYVRAYNGTASRWYQAALHQRGGQIRAAGTTLPVRFEPADPSLNERIDAAYRAKYRDSPYLGPMIGPGARRATIQILPAATASTE